MAWNDDKKAKAVELYQEADPTPENTIEICEQIAEELEETTNGVRMILVKAGVYTKKEPGKASGASAKSTTPRVSKADQHKSLIDAVENAGQKIDEAMVGRLSGKAAAELATIINNIVKGEEEE